MSTQRFADEFKVEAVKQVLGHGHRVGDVAARLGVSQHSLYEWIKQRRAVPSTGFNEAGARGPGKRHHRQRSAGVNSGMGLRALRAIGHNHDLSAHGESPR